MGKMLTIQQLSRQIAKDLRKNQTTAEKKLWNKLRDHKFLGLKFLRQHPLFYRQNGNLRFFISDFYCHEFKLVIEVDGGIHEQQEEYDQRRSEILESKSYRIIRFKNNDIFENIDEALLQLKQFIKKMEIN